MRITDSHLEKALAEFNDRVNDLEEKGSTRELLDAYINRGCVLSMMGSVVSAIDDFNEAAAIVEKLEAEGEELDPGYIVKIHVSRGELQSEQTMKRMLDDYRIASEHLSELKDGSKYYGRKDILEMCLNCASDLVDNDFPEESKAFSEKGLSLVIGMDDDYSRNCYVELSNLAGQARMDGEDNESALKYFTEAVRVGEALNSENRLSDMMDLVYAYISKGDMEEAMDMKEALVEDREAAIELLEMLKYTGSLDDEELLSNLHGETAQLYMNMGRIREAEKHLLKQVSYNLAGSTHYLDENQE